MSRIEVDVAGKIAHIVDMPVRCMHVDVESGTVGAVQHDRAPHGCGTMSPAERRTVDRFDHHAQAGFVMRREEIETDEQGDVTG